MPSGNPPLPEQVPATAYLTALARARATAQPGAALRDPYADRFARHCPDSVVGVIRHTAGTSVVIARTLAVDRLLSGLLGAEPWEVRVPSVPQRRDVPGPHSMIPARGIPRRENPR